MDILAFGSMYKCSVTKVLITCSITLYIMLYVVLRDSFISQGFIYSSENIINKYEIWRLFTAKIGFHETHTLFYGLILLYNFKVFERRFGSRNFLCFFLGTWLLSSVMELTIAYLFEIKLYMSGMYWLVFALSVYYFTDIPAIHNPALFGVIPSTQKLVYYAFLVHLCISSNEIILALSGVISGILYKNNFLWLKNWLIIPKVLYNPISSALDGLVGSKKPNIGLIGATEEVQRQMHLDEIERRLIQRNLHRVPMR